MKSCDLQNKRLTTRVVKSMNKFCLIYHQYRNSGQLLESNIYSLLDHILSSIFLLKNISVSVSTYLKDVKLKNY